MSQTGWASSWGAELRARGTDEDTTHQAWQSITPSICEKDDSGFSPQTRVMARPQRLHTGNFDKSAPFHVSIPSPVAIIQQIYYWHLTLKTDFICRIISLNL